MNPETYVSMVSKELAAKKFWSDYAYTWFVNNAATVIFVTGLYALNTIVGSYIRYEAGTDNLHIAAPWPVASVEFGWNNQGCFHQGLNEEQTICVFDKVK
jgi:hypothetical protein